MASTNGEVTYAIANSNGDFKIDQYSGEIRVAKELDRENCAHYKVGCAAVSPLPIWRGAFADPRGLQQAV